MKFWAVWRENGGAPPSKRHESFNSAVAEASRLCRQSGDRYFVLEVIGVVSVKDQPTQYYPVSSVLNVWDEKK
jgi:hypothetical protein